MVAFSLEAPTLYLFPGSSVDVTPSPPDRVEAFFTPDFYGSFTCFSVSSSILVSAPGVSRDSYLFNLVEGNLCLDTLDGDFFITSAAVHASLPLVLSEVLSWASSNVMFKVFPTVAVISPSSVLSVFRGDLSDSPSLV